MGNAKYKEFLYGEIFDDLRKECEEINNNPEKSKQVRYDVLQFSDIADKQVFKEGKLWNMIQIIAEFYNQNWKGNKDFLHMPDCRTILDNCMKYPIIIARDNRGELACVMTLKYDENTEENVASYFPIENAKFFSVTGILARQENKQKGIGANIYQIAIEAVYQYSRRHPDVHLIVEMDVRNENTITAAAKAIDKVREEGAAGKGNQLPAYIRGFYYLKDKKTKCMKEAPTLIAQIDLEQEPAKKISKHKTILNCAKQKGRTLFTSLKHELEDALRKFGLGKPVITEDEEEIVEFYELQTRSCHLEELVVYPNSTDKGNDRKPVNTAELFKFQGPFQSISMLEDDER